MADLSEAPELIHNLVLLGGRGCGKSAVSRRLLRREKRFMLFSLDAMIRYESGGVDVPTIVAREGWEGFRETEYRVACKAGAFAGQALLDCGGGIVVDLDVDGNEVYSERKVEALRRHGRVVYLQRETRYLQERIREDADRPELSATESFDEIMARRDPWYREAADWVFECTALDKTEITDRVIEWFYAQCRGRSAPSD